MELRLTVVLYARSNFSVEHGLVDITHPALFIHTILSPSSPPKAIVSLFHPSDYASGSSREFDIRHAEPVDR
jgi:hypothetical protein